MRRFLRRLIFWMLFIVSVYLGACQGISFLFLRAINRRSETHGCHIYFNYLWLRPDLKVELRDVGFTSDLSQHVWTAERAVLKFFWPALCVKRVSIDSAEFFNTNFSFRLSRFYKKWRGEDDPEIVYDRDKWVLKELDSRWDVGIKEFIVHNGRLEFYEDRNKKGKVDFYSTMTLENVSFLARNFFYPFREGPFSYRLVGDFIQKGEYAKLSILGTTELSTYDTKANLKIDNVLLHAIDTLLSSELARSIKSGWADVETEIICKDRKFDFPVNIHLDEFRINPDTTVFNVPYKMLTTFLAHTKCKMDIIMDVSGSIDDGPEFELRDKLNNQLRYGIENTLKGILNLPVNIVKTGAEAIGLKSKDKDDKPRRKEKKPQEPETDDID